jgi:hypothetical protein
MTVTTWDDYLTAARRLDEVRRQAASVVAEQAASVQAARQELATVRHRIGLQRARLLDVARRAGIPTPALVPTGSAPEPTDPAATVAALRAARGDLDAADASIAQFDRPDLAGGPLADWPVPRRNAVVYGAFAVAVLIVQLILFFGVTGTATSVLATACSAVLPIFGYGLAWLTVGLVFRTRGRGDRTPVLGAAISAVPVLLLCAGIGAFALAR